MRKKVASVAAAFALATSQLVAPSIAAAEQTPAVSEVHANQEIDSAEVSAAGSSSAALTIGAILAILAAIGGGAVWAIQLGYINNPLPSIIQSPPPRPVYGERCAWKQVLQPIRGRDGRWLVCVASPEPTWVYGPEPRGVGTAGEGEYCREGEKGGQDSFGRIMLCIQNEWVYGP